VSEGSHDKAISGVGRQAKVIFQTFNARANKCAGPLRGREAKPFERGKDNLFGGRVINSGLNVADKRCDKFGGEYGGEVENPVMTVKISPSRLDVGRRTNLNLRHYPSYSDKPLQQHPCILDLQPMMDIVHRQKVLDPP
jgi:hypothetical protein